jgi:hypothetical protein
MMLYLSGNSRPGISFAVNQAVRFTLAPKKSHGVAVKRIIRYFQGTDNICLVFRPSTDWKVDCYVDTDFCSLYYLWDMFVRMHFTVNETSEHTLNTYIAI